MNCPVCNVGQIYKSVYIPGEFACTYCNNAFTSHDLTCYNTRLVIESDGSLTTTTQEN